MELVGRENDGIQSAISPEGSEERRSQCFRQSAQILGGPETRPGPGEALPGHGNFLASTQRPREAAGKMLNLKRRSTKCLRPLVPRPHPQNSFDQETCARPVTCSARQDARGAGYQDRRISSWCMYHSPSLSASNRPD